jgi:acyl transferase domain-containing protein
VTANPDAIAIVGMAGRFPGAPDVRTYWENLCAGVDSVSDGTPAKGVLDGHDLFDAAFFGLSPKEAERTDPQHRLFLECAWEALEDAGYGKEATRPVTGVFAGSSMSRYLFDVLASPRHRDLLDDSQLLIGCDKDYLTMRASHKLNLRGPSVVVQTACSTSLVAVHLAGQALLAGECDLALAGGVAVRAGGGLDNNSARPDGMLSPDGRCRAFDASASGMVGGDGIGLVVLRRLDDALSDGDEIRAVILGTATNNDGSLKAGFTAPGIAGQTGVIRAAHLAAGVEPASIGYVEAHGTGTRLGDPIEVAALADVFAGSGTRRGLGSVKTNIGHLDAAAGVASLIKVVLSLQHKRIPATLHFRRPNPELRLEATSFEVVSADRPWQPVAGVRRAGVSSFGIGGTNAHAVLEEAPAPAASAATRPWQLIPVSARTAAARDASVRNLGPALSGLSDSGFADAAYTLQTGRQEFEFRAAIVAASGSAAAAEIAANSPMRVVRATAGAPAPVAFMFSGQGAEYAGMAQRLHATEPVFARELDAGIELLSAAGIDLRPALLDPDEAALAHTSVVQPALFTVEYALAQLWMSWGAEPAALIGHSVGELVAACVAGVLTPADAARLVVERGRAMADGPGGAMLAVAWPEQQVVAELPDGAAVAAVNAPGQTVLSGTEAAIGALERDYHQRGIRFRRLRTRHPFHTPAMAAAASRVTEVAASIPLRAPRRSVVSASTGTWLTAEQATDPEYWGRQVSSTVRFADGLRTLISAGHLLVEVGPGRTLCDLVSGAPAVPSLPGPGSNRDDLEVLLRSLGRLWLAGLPVRWPRLHAMRPRRRVSLPTYPFERRRYTVEPVAETLAAPAAEPAPATNPARLNDTEQAIARVFGRLLGLTDIDKDQSFFDLGGNSLVGIQVLDELSRAFQVDLPMAAFYESPTIAELALVIEDAVLTALENDEAA